MIEKLVKDKILVKIFDHPQEFPFFPKIHSTTEEYKERWKGRRQVRKLLRRLLKVFSWISTSCLSAEFYQIKSDEMD